MKGLTEVIIGIASALSGGFIATLLNFKLGSRKADTEEFKTIVDEYKVMASEMKAEISALKKELQDVRVEIGKLKDENDSLRTSLLLFETSHSSIPLPMWMKDTNGVMLFVNSYYEDEFLAPRGLTISDYVGQTDYDIWPEEVADGFGRNDRQVMRTKKPVRKIEKLAHPNGDVYWCELLKYPRMAEGKVIGISGLIMRTAEEKDRLL